MSKETYLFGIARMDSAEDLHNTRREAQADDTLFPDEKEEISAAVEARFGFLNRHAAGTPKARY